MMRCSRCETDQLFNCTSAALNRNSRPIKSVFRRICSSRRVSASDLAISYIFLQSHRFFHLHLCSFRESCSIPLGILWFVFGVLAEGIGHDPNCHLCDFVTSPVVVVCARSLINEVCYRAEILHAGSVAFTVGYIQIDFLQRLQALSHWFFHCPSLSEDNVRISMDSLNYDFFNGQICCQVR